jgi:hypothetical protein
MATMLGSMIAALALFMADGSSTTVSGKEDLVTYGCDDVVVVGRVKTIAYADLTQEDDLLGHGRYDMRVSVKRVLRGKETRRIIPASAFAHGQMRQDVDFWLVLRPVPGGGYVIRTGNLMRHPYKLAQTCGDVR